MQMEYYVINNVAMCSICEYVKLRDTTFTWCTVSDNTTVCPQPTSGCSCVVVPSYRSGEPHVCAYV